MLVFSAQSLVFIAVPKTGTTAIETALRPKADILFLKRRKHITAQRFHNRFAPFFTREFGLDLERFAVIREPEEQIRSWYRYRAREARQGSEFSTEGVSFDEFVLQVISDDPPPHAAIGSEMGILTNGQDALKVHHLFAHETPPRLLGFLESRFGEPVVLKPMNVSPTVKAELEPATLAKLKQARASEFDLYARVREAGGHLKTDLS